MVERAVERARLDGESGYVMTTLQIKRGTRKKGKRIEDEGEAALPATTNEEDERRGHNRESLEQI